MVTQVAEMEEMLRNKSSLTRMTKLLARVMRTLAKLMTIIDKIVTMLASKLRLHQAFKRKNQVVVAHQLRAISLIIIHLIISKQLLL